MAETLITEIDFSAAMGEAPRRGRGRPRKEKGEHPKPARPRGRPKGSTNKKPLDINNNMSSNGSSVDNKEYNVELKAKLTLKEINFLELYLAGGYTIEKAMIAAGYTGLSQSGLYYVAGKICKKYERAAPDAGHIFQDLGFGQVRVAQGIIDKAENARSEMVSLNALALAAKCLRMTSEPEGSHQGINIIINTGPGPGERGQPGLPSPVQIVIPGEPSSPAAPTKPLQIVR